MGLNQNLVKSDGTRKLSMELSQGTYEQKTKKFENTTIFGKINLQLPPIPLQAVPRPKISTVDAA